MPCMQSDSGIGPVLKQSFPPKPQFSVDQIPDLSGKVMIVTGGNVGIGYETVKVLLAHNAKVYLAARSREKAEAAIASLKELTGREAIFLELDLASLSAIRHAAENFMSQEPELHVLFNNAGVMAPPIDLVTKDGFDLQWGTNVVGPYLFTELLIPALLAGVATSSDRRARIVTTSSSVAYLETLHWDTFKDGPARRKMSPTTLYYQSKLGAAVVSRQFARRYGDQGIISIAVNPGNIQSELQRHASQVARKIMDAVMLYPTPYGALTQLYAGTMPEALGYNGEFLIPWARLGKCRPEMYDEDVGERMWKWLKDATNGVQSG